MKLTPHQIGWAIGFLIKLSAYGLIIAACIKYLTW